MRPLEIPPQDARRAAQCATPLGKPLTLSRRRPIGMQANRPARMRWITQGVGPWFPALRDFHPFRLRGGLDSALLDFLESRYGHAVRLVRRMCGQRSEGLNARRLHESQGLESSRLCAEGSFRRFSLNLAALPPSRQAAAGVRKPPSLKNTLPGQPSEA